MRHADTCNTLEGFVLTQYPDLKNCSFRHRQKVLQVLTQQTHARDTALVDALTMVTATMRETNDEALLACMKVEQLRTQFRGLRECLGIFDPSAVADLPLPGGSMTDAMEVRLHHESDGSMDDDQEL